MTTQHKAVWITAGVTLIVSIPTFVTVFRDTPPVPTPPSQVTVVIPDFKQTFHPERPNEAVKPRQDANFQPDIDSKPADEPPTREKEADSFFDGKWISRQFKYGFKIQGMSAIATLSNSNKFAVGDTILILDSIDSRTFSGKHMFNTGKWYQVKAERVSDNAIFMTGGGVEWSLERE